MMKFLLAVAMPNRSPYEPDPLDAQPSRIFGMATKDVLLIVGACVVLGLVLFLWVYLTRKEGRRSAGNGGRVIHRSHGDASHSGQRRRRRRHHRHQEEYRRNPTLQETGGLPPPRPDDSPGPSPAR